MSNLLPSRVLSTPDCEFTGQQRSNPYETAASDHQQAVDFFHEQVEHGPVGFSELPQDELDAAEARYALLQCQDAAQDAERAARGLPESTIAALAEVREAERAGRIPHCRNCGLVDFGQHFGAGCVLDLCDRCMTKTVLARVGVAMVQSVLADHIRNATAV